MSTESQQISIDCLKSRYTRTKTYIIIIVINYKRHFNMACISLNIYSFKILIYKKHFLFDGCAFIIEVHDFQGLDKLQRLI